MAIKIQITNFPTLKAFLEDNPELEVEIKGAVIQEFARRYLKDVAEKFSKGTLANQIRDGIKEEFIKEVKSSGYKKKYVLSDEYKEHIRAAFLEIIHEERVEALKMAQEVYKSTVNEHRKKLHGAAERIENRINDLLTEEKIQEVVEKLAEKKVLELLALATKKGAD